MSAEHPTGKPRPLGRGAVTREYKFVPELRPIRPARPEGQPRGRANYFRKAYASSNSPYPAQDKVIAFIEKQLAASGTPPSLEEIRRHMGWQNVSSVRGCLEKIAERGALPERFDRGAMARKYKPRLMRRVSA